MNIRPDNASQDRALSHAIINYVNAGYQGRFTFFNVLSRLNNPYFDSAKLEKTREVLLLSSGWMNEIWNNIFIFATSWKKPETFEAQKALTCLEELKADLRSLVQEMVKILLTRPFPAQPSHPGFLAAALARYAYARENYVRGFQEYGRHFNLPDQEKAYGEYLKGCGEDIKLAHEFMSILQKGETEKVSEFYPRLMYHCMRLPGVFREQIHDINQLMVPYKGGMSFAALEIPDDRAKAWQEMQVHPVIAGYWEAYGIGPVEADAWVQVGVSEYGFAATWKMHGFNPASAAPWAAEGFPVAVAFNWNSAGFKPDEALEKLQAGVFNPAEAAGQTAA